MLATGVADVILEKPPKLAPNGHADPVEKAALATT
jgi:hypothetical protein